MTDAGMCGAFDSSLGVRPEQAIRRFRTKLPARFDNDPGAVRLSGVLVEIDERTFQAVGIERINIE